MAAKTSASAAFNSFFYQHHQQVNGANGAGGKTQEGVIVTEPINDLHLKMSKKVAQLTKVVYALNSKNDDAENILENLRAQYEDEKERLIAENSRKLEEYNARFAHVNEQASRIADLEAQIRDNAIARERAMSEFEQLKASARDNEQRLSVAHKQDLVELNKMLMSVRDEQERQAQLFQAACAKMEKERAYAVEDLKSKHRLELEAMRATLDANRDSLRSDRRQVEEQYEAELAKVRADMEALATKAAAERAESEQNMAKLKAFHERELDALKLNSQGEFQLMIDSLKVELQRAEKTRGEMEADMRAKYERTLAQLVEKETQVERLSKELADLAQRHAGADQQLVSLSAKLTEVESERSALSAQCGELEEELRSLRAKCETLSHQLVERSSVVSKLEASDMQKTATIGDLESELRRVRERLDALDAERRSLADTSMSQNDKYARQMRELERRLQTLGEERDAEQAENARRLALLNEQHAQSVSALHADYGSRMDEVTRAHEAALGMQQALHDERVLTIQRDLSKDFNAENLKLLAERNELRVELSKTLDELKAKTREHETDTSALGQRLALVQRQLADALASSRTLGEERQAWQGEALAGRSTIGQQAAQIATLQAELDELRMLHDASSKDSQLELKVKMERLSKELNAKWSDTVKVECEALRVELNKLKEEEKQAELAKLTELKEDEIRNLKAIWQAKTNELLDEISMLRRDLANREQEERERVSSVTSELERANRELRDKLGKLDDEYRFKLERLRAEQSDEAKSLVAGVVRENESRLAELVHKHMDDLRCQSLAHRVALDEMRATLEKSKQLELEVAQEAHTNALATLKYELEQAYFMEMDQLKHENECEMMELRGELEASVDKLKQRERAFEIRVDDLQSDIRLKQKHVAKLSDEMRELHALNAALKLDVEAKSVELTKLAGDYEREMRVKEAELAEQVAALSARMDAESKRQRQALVAEFREAQELLKEKIADTEEQLRVMNQRYMDRESRQEDVETIRSLRGQLADLEQALDNLRNEKKYFQMELLNRENNFNKMFNASPNIGIINPLNANTKIKAKGQQQKKSMGKQTASSASSASSFVHSTALVGRLDPIPGVDSPLHDLNLNPNKMLPKKFLN